MGKTSKFNTRSICGNPLPTLIFLLLTTFLAGCGYLVTPLIPALPQKPPPSGPPPSSTQSGTVTISPRYAALGQGASLQFHGTVAGGTALQWLVNNIAGGNSSVGTVDGNGNYTAPAILSQSQNITVTAQSPASPQSNFASAVVSLIQPGTVAVTANPQVAAYSIYLPAPGSVTIAFGPTTGYGLVTWSQTTPSPTGGMVNIYVAGMQAQTSYHMRAQVVLADGATYSDSDQSFLSGTPPATATVDASTPNGGTPQGGIELFDTTIPAEPARVFATDLQGNVIWTYSYPASPLDVVQPVKLLPNGHFLVQISYASSTAFQQSRFPPSTLDEVREVDLAGNTVRSLTQQQLASALAAQGYNFNLGGLHHDVLPLPNGHLVLLCSLIQNFSSLPGYPHGISVLGDLLVDVDQNFNPDWVWNSFDHMDVNRHPFKFPDWLHSNALLYSADDHNLLLSIRHQNWIVKIDFNDAKGSGNILWRLGEGGDFRLQGGSDPQDWFYAQHGPNYFSPNTTGVFTLGIMDNGDDRIFPSGITCGASSGPPCLYSTAEVLQVDESTMVATIVSDYQPASSYSFYGGNVDPLANGDYEVDFCAPVAGALVQELNPATQTVVWQATTPGANQYRAFRLPSLYPGVQW